MKIIQRSGWFRMVWCLCLLVTIHWGTHRALAADSKGDLKFQVQLLWGTNDDKPPGQDLKEVEPRIMEGLKGIFKWKNYFEVTRKNLSVAPNATQRLKLSDKCEVEVQNLG